MITVMAVQTALKAKGYDPGPLDGILGRMTLGAVARCRLDLGLEEAGGIDQDFVSRLLDGNPVLPDVGDAPWYTIGWRKLHQHERLHKRDIWSFLASDGKSLGDPSRNPWCGDFVETCIALALPNEALPNNPYGARNWSSFGREIPADGLRMGAILVFWRGSRDGWKGHVGFYNGEDANHYSVLGGNQGNRVSVARLRKERLLTARWPSTFTYQGGQPRNIDGGVPISENEA